MIHPIEPNRWRQLAAEPRFRALVRARRRFVLPATLFFLAYYLALPVSVGFFRERMSRPIAGPLTLAYAFALSQFAMAWLLLGLYLWRSRAFDAQAKQIRIQESEEITGALS